MRFTNSSSVVALIATATAYTITSPSGGCIDITLPVTVTWTASPSETPSTVSFALANYISSNPPVDRLYENIVVNASQSSQGSVTLPGLDRATALDYSKNGGKDYRIWMVPANSPPPHNGNLVTESGSFRIVALGSGKFAPLPFRRA
ncbi:Ser-Thr-rich glycosyl-phosphatidyl-inositol-anchored membrane family-domain-containing protein [Penicillium cosmopolitanum]|uniref:Ser-Thr-rich glycosyl-phosphatidyl-inositol-anchored membrane family-domain-containing protein n=1 Tax=Penicillium cosmopolitanum TaxID=1131564 RepID=A0A9W9VXL2_9EURO|nr:Ser-Thr-rich glycosyl-phosphatidyl-inositol-anchored membrane family-domain-containing protein [Penicillium cosmopolitanum]KAJ5391156.1 Ser-Thr-rich glycosyl-phosphatidyl-inositol-anchored membrane family-domain-containing protein [Penicillium cosmopolitanum]